jgi:hypothetical protein
MILSLNPLYCVFTTAMLNFNQLFIALFQKFHVIINIVITNFNTKAINMTDLIKHHITDKLFVIYQHMYK